MIVLPGPILLADPLPSGWRRCSSLGCGAPTGHDGAHVPEAVPPVAVAPAGRWMHRCRGNARCGLPEGHEGVHASVPEAPCTCEPDMQCYPCSGLVWQAAAAAVAVAGPEAVPPVAVMHRDVKPENVVERTPGVMGGRVCIAGTRIDVLGLVGYLPEWTPAKIQRDAYPHLSLATIEAALAWAEAHPDEVERDRRDAEVDVAAELSATVSARPIELSATRAERIEAAARALVLARQRFYDDLRSADREADAEPVGLAHVALRAALCTCNAHGPDPACVDHGAAIAAWQRENTP